MKDLNPETFADNHSTENYKKFTTELEQQLKDVNEQFNHINLEINALRELSSGAVRYEEVSKLNKPGIFENNRTYQITTPFGDVIMQTLEDGERLIFPYRFESDKYAVSYKKILQVLDDFANHEPNSEKALDIATKIHTYLSRPISTLLYGSKPVKKTTTLNDGVEMTYEKIPPPKEAVKLAAACLSAILLLCESNHMRSPTGGKWERAVINTVIDNLNTGGSNPFKNAFEWYVPRISEKRKKAEGTSDAKKGEVVELGGKGRAKILTGGNYLPPFEDYLTTYPKEKYTKDIENTGNLLLSDSAGSLAESGTAKRETKKTTPQK